MANNRATYQQVNNVSLNKAKLRDIAIYSTFDETDYRVLIMLFTELNGWVPTERAVDPLNYKKIDKESIALSLGISKKKVNKALDNLLEVGLIERGSSDTIEKGWRFTF